MDVATKTPIYISNHVPDKVKPHDLHMDFELSTPYVINNTSWYDKTDIRYYQERYPTNSIIVHDELIRLCEFWRLSLCEASDYIGGFPYENQLEVKDFYERFSEKEGVSIDNIPKPLIVSTKDLVFNGKELHFEICNLQRKIENQTRNLIYEISMEQERRKLPSILANDPLVLVPVDLKLKSTSKNLGYIVASAWDFEKELV